MRAATAIALIQLAVGVAIFLLARLYVAALLRLQSLRGAAKVAASLVLYLSFVPFIVAPVFAVLAQPSLRDWASSSWFGTAWLLLCFGAAVSPCLWYIFRVRGAELRAAGFFRETPAA